MNTLTDKKKELLSNPDVKDLILEFANWQIMGMDKGMLGIQFDSFASQFERKLRFVTNGDGEEIFDGDEYIYINTEINKIHKGTCDLLSGVVDTNAETVAVGKATIVQKVWNFIMGVNPIILLVTKDMGNKIYFKSKEKATEYVLLNSPNLSVNECVNQVVSELNEWKLFSEDPKALAISRDKIQEKLINLIKSKQ